MQDTVIHYRIRAAAVIGDDKGVSSSFGMRGAESGFGRYLAGRRISANRSMKHSSAKSVRKQACASTLGTSSRSSRPPVSI
jgi:hypothetical protein